MKNFCGCCLFVVPFLVHSQWTKLPMDHCVFRFATRGQCIKEKKLDGFEHNHVFCFKLQCASIVVLLCTAIWWKLKDTVVHWTTVTYLIAEWRLRPVCWTSTSRHRRRCWWGTVWRDFSKLFASSSSAIPCQCWGGAAAGTTCSSGPEHENGTNLKRLQN